MRDRRLVPYHVPLKHRSRILRGDSTPAERKLWYEFLRDLPEKFTRQKPLGAYIADFYCSRARLIIEIDGDSHYTKHGEAHDVRRSTKLEGQRLRIIRFTNAEVMQQFEAVCQRIEDALKEKT